MTLEDRRVKVPWLHPQQPRLLTSIPVKWPECGGEPLDG